MDVSNAAAVAEPPSGISSRFNAWLLERLRKSRGVTSLPHELEYRQIFILPTRFGFWFGVLLIVMTVGGLNFNNNMTLLLSFLVSSLALLTTLLAYRNLVGLRLLSIHADPVFAGDRAAFRVLLENPELRGRYAIQVCNDDSTDASDISPQSSAKLVIEQPSLQRGWLECAPFHIENRYPFGLFRAWSVVIPRARCLVYPKPAAHAPPLPKSGRGDEGAALAKQGEHFHGLREYQPGDPLRQIAWRASARHQKLYSRQMETPNEDACEFNWYLMAGNDNEEKLSILAAWILRAERHHIPYSLELPTAALPADLGDEHRDACLEILALYKT